MQDSNVENTKVYITGYRVNTIMGLIDYRDDKRKALKTFRKWQSMAIPATLEKYRIYATQTDQKILRVEIQST